MLGHAVIIILTVALLLAVGLLIFGVGRFIYGIAHYYLRERKPVREIRHQQLGLLTSAETDSSLWEGQARIDGRNIPFVIGGSSTAPDERLVAQLQKIISCFSSMERQAIEFLQNGEPAVRDAKLDAYLIDVSDERCHGDFIFEFVAGENDSQIWRVEFVNGQPKNTGYDD